MPPNSTQNLNARLSPTGQQRLGGPAPDSTPRPIRSSAPEVKIFSGPRRYRGGYYLNV
jgi:hypothetical protein